MKLLYRSQPSVAIALMSLLATTEVYAQSVKYNFTEIANTNGNLKTVSSAVINNLGYVGFNAQLDDGKEGVFRSDGKTTTTIVNPTSNFSYITNVSINDVGSMAFIAYQNSQNPHTTGVYISNGINLKPIKTIATTTESGVGIQSDSFRAVSLNNSGVVAFTQVGARRGEFVYTSDGSTTKQIASTDVLIPSIQINDFSAVVYAKIDLGVYVGDGNTTKVIDDAPIVNQRSTGFFTSASINNIGSVAYVKTPAEESNSSTIKTQVLRKKGDRITTIADTDGDFSSFGSTSINDKGTVAFSANLDAGGAGIFTGKNSKTNKVIATGDSLFGYTVVALGFASEGLNNYDQITFVATLANNTQVVVRANPRRGNRGT